MKHTLSILVENHAGVLSRVTGLFSRRGFNIDSLAVGITDDVDISRITIVVDGNNYIVEQVEKQLNKLIDVIKIQRIPDEEMVSRELVVIKLKNTTMESVAKIQGLCNIRVCEIVGKTIIVELCDTPEKVNIAIEEMSIEKIVELVRTGVVALSDSESLAVE